MARIYPLFSSSSGNSHFVGTPEAGILIDAGVSCKRVTQALCQNDIPPSAVKAIFITHDHSDHIAGLKIFTKSHPVPVISSEKTLEYLIEHDHVDPKCRLIAAGDKEITGFGFAVKAFSTPHDAVGSVGYKIKTPDGKTICLCTDLGHITEEIDAHLLGSDLVLLESNYDEHMLKTGPYPYVLKQRILSPRGHLSNIESSKEVKRLIEFGTAKIILGHLSRENNTPVVATNTLMRELGDDFVRDRDYVLHIAPIETNGLAVEF
ncbi:MAG: MBL fold metallo-hydrolase [Oscillospiraceae bacterium]|nr:MBL fold metallo-hydrolase [Oscillospiraceae bacterium]